MHLEVRDAFYSLNITFVYCVFISFIKIKNSQYLKKIIICLHYKLELWIYLVGFSIKESKNTVTF